MIGGAGRVLFGAGAVAVQGVGEGGLQDVDVGAGEAVEEGEDVGIGEDGEGYYFVD